ncbi:hypothetical protein ACQBAT_05345 [Ornithinimicrobium sp. Y1847]|uniref:hypothetical protein n=1 Tax=Ornithinimicrobium sp. Y1847 TaxID=3405419 RepID=UPI003B681978
MSDGVDGRGDGRNSNDRTTGSGPGSGQHDKRPMLVLGQRGPAVEDTTIEELRREQAELDRRRAELEQEARRRRRQADNEITASRKQIERDLARRERELQDAERKLYRASQRARRQARASGQEHLIPDRPAPPAEQRLRNSGAPARFAWFAVALGILSVLFAAMTAPALDAADDWRTELAASQAWDEVQLESTLLLRERLTDSADVAAARDRVDQAVAAAADLTPAERRYEGYQAGTIEEALTTVTEDGSPVRVAAAWERLSSIVSTVVPTYLLRNAAAELAPWPLFAWLLLAGAAGCLIALAFQALQREAWLALALVAASVVALGVSAVFLQMSRGGVSAELEEVTTTTRTVDSLRLGHSSDVKRVLGLRVSGTDDEYWDGPYRGPDLEGVPSAVGQAYAQARADMTGASEQDQLEMLEPLTESLRPVLADRHHQASEAADTLVDRLNEQPPGWPMLLAVVISGALGVLALFAPAPDAGVQKRARRKEWKDTNWP